MTTKTKRTPIADFNPKNQKSGVGALPGLGLDGAMSLMTRTRDAAACDAMAQQKPGSVSKGFDPKPALPPHRRPRVQP